MPKLRTLYDLWEETIQNPGLCRVLYFSWSAYCKEEDFPAFFLEKFDGCPVLFPDDSEFGIVLNGGEHDYHTAYIVPRGSCVETSGFFWR